MLGELLIRSGKNGQGEELLRRKLAAQDRVNPPTCIHTGSTLQRLAEYLCDHDDASEALPLARRACAIFEATYSYPSFAIANAQLLVARCLVKLDARADALEAARSAYTCALDSVGTEHELTRSLDAMIKQLEAPTGGATHPPDRVPLNPPHTP